MKIKAIDTRFFYIGAPLFLIGLAFLNRSYELIYVYFAALWLGNRESKITKTSFLLICLGICFVFFSLINYDEGILTTILKCMIYWSFYQIGTILYRKYTAKEYSLDTIVFYILFAFASGCFLRYAIDVAQSWVKVLNHHRWIVDIWTHAETTATIGGGWCVPLACIFYYSLSTNKYRFPIKLIVYAEVAIALFFNILTGTRNFLIIFTVTTFVAFAYNELFGRKNKKRLFRVIAVVLFLVILVSILYSSNSFGFKDYIQRSTLLMRVSEGELSNSSMNDNGRVERYIYILSNLQLVFWGGSHCEEMGMRIHNWFLQCLDIYGFIAMVLLIVVFIKVFKSYNFYLKNKKIDMTTKVLLLSIIVTFTLYGMIEPVITSNNIVISLLFLVAGILDNNKKYEVGTNERYKNADQFHPVRNGR